MNLYPETMPATPDLPPSVPEEGRWRRHLLTIGLEDYFQVGTFNRLIQRGQWYRFESRLEQNVHRTLDLLDEYKARATFFTLGWIADQYPELLEQVVQRGHEIASKGYYHRPLASMSPVEFEDDAITSREALEEATRQRVYGYRLSDGWFTPKDFWALDKLVDLGFAYDSSLAPLGRQFRKEPYRQAMHRHATPYGPLWEFPIGSIQLAGWSLPISGGNYFRQLPMWFLKKQTEKVSRRQEGPMTFYFHTWEIDPAQPRITAGTMLGRIRHYRNLDRMEDRLRYMLENYRFTSIADYLKLNLQLKREPGSTKPPSQPDLRLKRRTSTEFDLKIPEEVLRMERRLPVSIVIPLYNEEQVLPFLANTLQSVHEQLAPIYDIEFILVNDGSKDKTPQLLESIFGSKAHVRIVHHSVNSGVASAIMTGIRAAQTELVCSMDCDCSYDPHELQSMIPMLERNIDLVTASPYHPLGHVRNVPGWRLWLSKRASQCYRWILRHKLHTYTSCFRVYRRERFAGMQLSRGGYLGVAEMLALLDMSGGKIVEYPTTLEVRVLGRSKMKTVRTIIGHLKLMASLLTRRYRGQISPPPEQRPEDKILNRLRELNIDPVVERLTTTSR